MTSNADGHTFALLSYYGNLIESYDTFDEARAHLDEFLVEPDSADGIGLLEYNAAGVCVRRHWPEAEEHR